jgi:hypothetical protein
MDHSDRLLNRAIIAPGERLYAESAGAVDSVDALRLRTRMVVDARLPIK